MTEEYSLALNRLKNIREYAMAGEAGAALCELRMMAKGLRRINGRSA